MDQFALTSPVTIDVQPLGRSGEQMLMIDDISRHPEHLIAAASASNWTEMAAGGYPGRRAPLPGDYARGILRKLDRPIRDRLFSGRSVSIDRFDCTFSMVTRPASGLTPMQRIPHIDTVQPMRIAILHYLCGPKFGGTAFFRQIRTGFEKVSPEDQARYHVAREQDLADLAPSDGYPGAATPGYERTCFAEARFNRIIAYRSHMLHSGMIDAPEALTNDPKFGRLTATFFVDYK